MNQKKRSELEQEFVNLYCANWGGNAGLRSDRIKNMGDRELEQCVRSQRDFLKLTETHQK